MFQFPRKGRSWIWWGGVPIAVAVWTVLPYWILNHSSPLLQSSWWRVPVMTPGVFDTYVYLHWMGALVGGIPYGGHFKWFGWVIVGLWKLIHSWASLPELWLITRWMTTTLSVWTGAWAIRQASDLDVWKSRFLSLGMWFAIVLTLGMRPGAYSWYLPFCLAGMACVWVVERLLREHHFFKAIGWSLFGLALSYLYPWFFLLVGLWLVVLWMRSLIALLRHPSWIFFLAIFSVWAISVPLAKWFLDPARVGLLGMYERNGVVFTHVPFFANTLLAMGLWITLIILQVRHRPGKPAASILLPWLVLLFLWFHPVFTGIFLYPDHFIGPVAVLSWMSLGWMWKGGEQSLKKRVLLFLPVGATLFFLYILQQPLRLHPYKFDPYVIHLAHWLALAGAGWLWVAAGKERGTRLVMGVVMGLAVGIGLMGARSPLVRDVPHVTEVAMQLPSITWIRAHVPLTAKICSDPSTALFYAAHTGRTIYPAEPVMSYPVSSEIVLQELETLAGAYDASSTGQFASFQFLTDHYRIISCSQGSKYAHNGMYAVLFHRLGWSDDALNQFIGCHESVIKKNWERIKIALNRHQMDAVRFRELCPSVIVKKGERDAWQFPPEYHKLLDERLVEIWGR